MKSLLLFLICAGALLAQAECPEGYVFNPDSNSCELYCWNGCPYYDPPPQGLVAEDEPPPQGCNNVDLLPSGADWRTLPGQWRLGFIATDCRVDGVRVRGGEGQSVCQVTESVTAGGNKSVSGTASGVCACVVNNVIREAISITVNGNAVSYSCDFPSTLGAYGAALVEDTRITAAGSASGNGVSVVGDVSVNCGYKPIGQSDNPTSCLAAGRSQ